MKFTLTLIPLLLAACSLGAQEGEREWLAITQQLAAGMEDSVREQALDPASTLWKTDRDALDVAVRRLAPMMDAIAKLPGAPDLTAERKALGALEESAKSVPVAEVKARQALFASAVQLRRQTALKNPLLNFSDLLFIKRHPCVGDEYKGAHMIDQFFGQHQQAGGGVFVLKNAFSDAPTLVNALEGSTFDTPDKSWAFLAPELSYDTREVLFAATDTKAPRHTFEWTAENTFHVYRAKFDPQTGKLADIRQLTSGAFDDFDPCFLPNGRILFVSTRRLGYGRCHPRVVPTYTLHSMNADGSDLVTLSWHETNEWQPSIDHNGMVIYTRWDYVDRGANNAHHPWITTPDGRDPRALTGNYHESQARVPIMELNLRAVPGSNKLTGTAAGHHGQYFGSLVLIDPQTRDDNLMSAVRRITPDQLFPESELGIYGEQPCGYGQCYPLSEQFYLCVYDPFSKWNGGPANNYGIYLLDAFGNKVLLYRDPAISCQDVIPIRLRDREPIVPHRILEGQPLAEGETFQPLNKEELPKTANVGLINVYDTKLPFPEGTKIERLRIVQILPKTTPLESRPWIGYGHQKGARLVLGTVPVEADGSAYFSMPVNIPVYFQALDGNGVAVQSMRSDTYVHAGEELVCQGCHEDRHTAMNARPKVPTAMRRAPSVIQPDPDGSGPLSFPRLIQPILDAKCVDCHQKSTDPKAIDLSRGPENEHFYASFRNLKSYCFFYDHYLWTEPQTLPGKFGSNASRLYEILKSDHYGLQLTKEEMYRFTLWMDNNCDFYGSYDHCELQRAGEVVKPELE